MSVTVVTKPCDAGHLPLFPSKVGYELELA
jgi:hypothetical protein